MIVKRKLYSNSRLGDTIQVGTLGSILGAGFGAIPGAILGGKRGAMIGALIGAALTGYTFGKGAWIGSGDKANKIPDNKRKLLEEFKKDPRQYFKKIFDEEKKLYSQYNAILGEFDKDHKFPKELEKYLRIREQFIPKILEWIDRFEVKNPGVVFEIMYVPIYPETLRSELKDKYEDDYGFACTLFLNPVQADDTFITYSLETGKYGLYFEDKDCTMNLKSAILEALSNEEYGFRITKDESAIWLLGEYRKFISTKL